MELYPHVSHDAAMFPENLTHKPHALLDKHDVQLFASSEYVLVRHTSCWTRNVLNATPAHSVYVIRERELGTNTVISI